MVVAEHNPLVIKKIPWIRDKIRLKQQNGGMHNYHGIYLFIFCSVKPNRLTE